MHFSRLTRGTSVLVGCIFALAMASCSMKQEGPSRLSIQIPSAKSLAGSQKISAMSYSWDSACFMVSVKGEGIENSPENTCSVSVGRFAGSVPAGGVLSIEVPRGGARKLELFVTFKSSATASCPTVHSLSEVNATSTVLVGHVDSFDTYVTDTNVDVTVSLPGSSQNLITQYSLPASCKFAGYVSGPGASALVAGHAIQTGGTFKAQSTVSGRQSEKVLQGGGFVMKLTRRPNEE